MHELILTDSTGRLHRSAELELIEDQRLATLDMLASLGGDRLTGGMKTVRGTVTWPTERDFRAGVS